MKRCLGRQFAFVIAAALLAARCVLAQETTAIVVLPEQPANLEIGLLKPTDQEHAVLPVRSTGPTPVQVSIPPGTVFLPVGDGQGVMTTGGAGGMVKSDIPVSTRHAGAARSAIQFVAASGETAPAPDPDRPWTEIPVSIVCFEEKRPDPQPATRWRLASAQEIDRQGLGWLRRDVQEIAAAAARIDRQIDDLAGRIHSRREDGQWHLVYDGEPLGETAANLLLSADWSVAADGRVSGVLNRSVVVQFAVWTLSDGATRTQLVARLSEPRFADLQARSRALRWSIEHLLTEAGFDAGSFARDAAATAKPEEKPGR
jgi:hypothetical protein